MTTLINKPKAKRLSKKVVIKMIMETPTSTGGEFDVVSLEEGGRGDIPLRYGPWPVWSFWHWLADLGKSHDPS